MKEKRRHKNLPEVVLPEELRLTADLKEAMAEKDILVLAVTSSLPVFMLGIRLSMAFEI